MADWTRRWSGAVLLLLVAGLAGCAPAPSTHGTFPTPTDGYASEQRQYAGHVPWSSAVLERDQRTLHLLADWDRTDGYLCDTPNEHIHLQQNAARVTITIDGYARPLPPNVGCAGVGHELQPHTVHLAVPLGIRPLFDGGHGHQLAVLIDASIQNSSEVPAGYGTSALTWDTDETRKDTVVRTWQNRPLQQHGAPNLLRLTVGLPTFYTFIGPAGPKIGNTTINGETATINGTTSGQQITTTIRWTRSNGQQTELEALGTPKQHLTLPRLEAFARSLGPDNATPRIVGGPSPR